MTEQSQTNDASGAAAEPRVFDYTGPAGDEQPNGNKQQNLPLDLIAALTDICRKVDAQELQSRIRLVTRVQKARFFWRGQQYLLRDSEKNGGTYSIRYQDPATLEDGEDRDPMYSWNLYKAYGRSFVATFAQASVGVAFEPNDPQQEADTTASTEADNAKKIVCKVNNQRDLQKKIAKLLWTDPYVVFLTEDSTNGSKFGHDKNGDPRHYPEINVSGALEWKLPIACGEFDDWPYLRRQREVALTTAKEAYPEKKDKLSGAGSVGAKDTDYSRQARLSTQEGLGITQQSGDAMAFMETESNYLLRPSSYWEITDPDRLAMLKQWFPHGGKVTFVGEQYVRSEDYDIADHVVVFKGDPGEGYATPALGDILLDPQEAFNDLANLARTTFVRGVPHGFFDQDVIPAESVPHQKNNPGSKHPVNQPADGQPLAAHFHEETPAETPVTMMQYMADLKGATSQFLSGQQPALFGGEMGEAGKTATGYGQALAQAMGQMTIVWVPFKKAWAEVMKQAVGILAMSHADSGKLSTTINAGTPDAETITLNLENLKGNWLTSPDTDENFPESWSMKRANYQSILSMADKSPEMGRLLMHPDNLRLGKDLLGLKEFVDPDEDSRDKQMTEIEEMLKAPTVPTPEAAQQIQQMQAAVAAGQIPPEVFKAQVVQLPQQSSVDVDPDYDNHVVELETVKTWINSLEGQKAKQTDPQGFNNVRLHGLQHKQLVEQAQANQQQQNKPPSTSINFKDLPVDGQLQLAAEAGLKLQPPQVLPSAPVQ